jgi:L-lysine 6-transaminase
MNVIERLKQHILVDGFHVVADLQKSKGSWIKDAETGKEYLDCYSQFASQPFGWNYEPFMNKDMTRLREIAHLKLANSDMYSEIYADFVEAFAGITADFSHYFFVEGGAMGVENSLKAAFDWKCQKDPRHQASDGARLEIIHLYEAFHGRSGYALSLTNSGEIKTKWFPKFDWPRVTNPKIVFPLNEAERHQVEHWEEIALEEIEQAASRLCAAALIIEPIQGEGGDNHFRPEFFRQLRKLANEWGFMLILDEVQTGMGITGRWWAYQHMDIVPDMISFGKKSQVCGFCSTRRIDEAPQNVFVQSGRINSTWGGNLVDMERARLIIEVIKDSNLVSNADIVGSYFLDRLQALNSSEITNVRGRGLMLAFDLPNAERRNEVIHNLHEVGLLALKSGQKSIRFRPPLTFSSQDARQAVDFIKKVLN